MGQKKPDDEATSVVIYTRFSSTLQDARSIDDQLRRCRAYAAVHGLRVIAEYADAALSGAHTERAELQKLLAAARVKGGAQFGAVLVDDLSRLSRDLGNTWQIVFHDLWSANVKVIDVTTGMASDNAGARLTFGAMALVNDTFLQLVRTETHRGLEGRALGGFSTGGRCYGYSTVVEENPPDPEHPRKRCVIDPVDAAVVVRVFTLFIEGMSLKKIAALLNSERLPAPNDGGRGNKNGHGWGHTTIRAMLKNERYRGRVTWNQSKWIRVPDRKTRRRVARPETEWVTHEYPELAIIGEELWDAVQARFSKVYTARMGRPAGTGNRVHLISGLMRCGACGGSMTVVGRRTKNGVEYTRFGCTAHASRGSAICANSLSVSERRASKMLVDALKAKFVTPALVTRFTETFTARAKELAGSSSGATFEKRIRDGERRIANLTEAMAKVGWSDALASKLRDEEKELGQLKADRMANARENKVHAVPPPEAIAGYLKNLFAVLDADPVRGREILTRFVAPIVMTPEGDGPNRHYRATGAFDLSFILTASANRSGKSGCAGPIRPLDHAVFVDFVESLVA